MYKDIFNKSYMSTLCDHFLEFFVISTQIYVQNGKESAIGKAKSQISQITHNRSRSGATNLCESHSWEPLDH